MDKPIYLYELIRGAPRKEAPLDRRLCFACIKCSRRFGSKFWDVQVDTDKLDLNKLVPGRTYVIEELKFTYFKLVSFNLIERGETTTIRFEIFSL